MAARARAVLALAALAAAGCVQDDGSRNPLKALTTVNVAQERQMGARGDAYFRENLPLIDDPVVLGFLNDLGQGMVRHLEPQPFVYRFRVVQDPQLNAFALPGGYIYFNSGTILAAHSLDELAGVMAHEVAHSKRSHIARMIEKQAIPDLLAKVLGAGAAIATESPGPMIIAEGVSQSMRLAYTREFEAEADEVGTVFMVREGYDPMGMATFFDRLLAQKRPTDIVIPDYLYSHPRTETRLEDAIARARETTIPGREPPGIRDAFRTAQVRLGLLLEEKRTTLPPNAPLPDRARASGFLSRAEEKLRSGDSAGALAVLAEGERAEPYDPRLAFRAGEMHEDLGQHELAIAAYARAILLDPETALTYYRVGLVYKELGDKPNAVFYLEQAERRFEKKGQLRLAAQEQIQLLTFPIVSLSGIGDGHAGEDADTPAGHTIEEVRVGTREIAWWGSFEPEWMSRREEVQLRWIDPRGSVVFEGPAEEARKPYAIARFALPSDAVERVGIWRVEATLDGERASRTTFRLVP